MSQSEISWVERLIDKHGIGSYKDMAMDTSINTKKLTMGKIQKMCDAYEVWSEGSNAAAAASAAAHRAFLPTPAGVRNKHAERAWLSGKGTGERILRSLRLPPQRSACLEVCCDTVASAVAAVDGGCHRLELCSALGVGGLTPSPGLLRAVHTRINGRVPIHVLLRPREGDFCYDDEEIDVMLEDIVWMARYGAAGIVLGVLDCEGNVDFEKSLLLIQRAKQHGLTTTFHRAIDVSRDLLDTIDQCISLGVDRVLTSGGAACVVEGKASLLDMVRRSENSALSSSSCGMLIMAGGGLSEENVSDLIVSTSVHEVHGSLRTKKSSGMTFQRDGVSMGSDSNEQVRWVCDTRRVRATVEALERVVGQQSTLKQGKSR